MVVFLLIAIYKYEMKIYDNILYNVFLDGITRAKSKIMLMDLFIHFLVLLDVVDTFELGACIDLQTL